MKISDYIRENTTAKFLYYRDGELWYKLSGGGFEFPVPIADTAGAMFKAEDKGIFFMRWVRKHLEMLEKEAEMIEKARQEHLAEMARRAAGEEASDRSIAPKTDEDIP